MAILLSCDLKYFDEYATLLVRSAKANTAEKRVYISVVTEQMEPWQLASERFFFAQKLDEPELIIVDADSLFVGPPEFPAGGVGLYLRPEAPEKTKVAAGLVVIRDRGFLDALCENLRRESGWFADQIALWKTYCGYGGDYFDVSPFLTWEFDEKPIWTGKGPRKRSKIFRSKMNEFGA
ncbi:MAG: hypothetical protein AAF942_00115 [Pseudomonadota bacterium]